MSTTAVKFKVNGTEYSLSYNSSTQKWQATITAPGATSFNLTDHAYACEVSATNNAGTTTTVTTSDATVGSALKLRVKETVAPTISISAPSSGAYVTTNKPAITFVVTDETGGSGIDLSNLVVKVDGSAVTGGVTSAITNGYSCSYTPSAALSDGSHTVTIDAKDNDGNAAAQATASFTVDTIAPSLSISLPAADAVLSTSTVGYSGTTNDSTSSPVTVTVALDGVAQTSPTVGSGGAFSGSISGVTDGAHTLSFTSTDAAGKATTVEVSFTVNTAVPVITSVSISPNPVDAGATMLVEVEIE